MAAVTEPGRQPARRSSRPVPCCQSDCSSVDVEACQRRAEAVSICLWCYSPLNRSTGASPLKICHFFHYFYSNDFLFFLVFPKQSKTHQYSPPPRQRALTRVGRLILVCNIVYVPRTALYYMYRLLEDGKKCIGHVISRYFKA